MRTLLTFIIALASSTTFSAEIETITGIVVEQRANTKTFDSWNSPSDPYYILDMGPIVDRFRDGSNSWERTRNKRVTLRPSASTSTETLATFTGKTIWVVGYFTKGTPYQPASHIEQYPVEPILAFDENDNPTFTDSRPAYHGSGFIVKEIKAKREDTEHAPPEGGGEAPCP